MEIDGKKEDLDGDKTKTLFDFDSEVKAIKVTKAGFKDAEEVKTYKIIDGDNKISVVMEIKEVHIVYHNKADISKIISSSFL